MLDTRLLDCLSAAFSFLATKPNSILAEEQLPPLQFQQHSHLTSQADRIKQETLLHEQTYNTVTVRKDGQV